jgi:hypothetical protein
MTRRDLVGLLVAIAVDAMSSAPALAGEAGAAPHAYYLFFAGAPQSCEDCYVPLFITERPLEDVSSSGRDGAVLITTYERDSIWTGERVVRLRGRRYRYQEVTAAEVLRLLEKPAGTIPIHRTAPIPDTRSLEDLAGAFRGRK